jgi:hypothetical protein
VSAPVLSVICTVGPRRGRAERAVQVLSKQTAAEKIELIMIDAAPGEDPLESPEAIPSKVISARPGATLGEARAAGLAAARGEAVAFLTDHTRPEPEWAAALISAYSDGPWGAVGYCFGNSHPDAYGARAAMYADFAPWLDSTTRAEVDHLPPLDVSYRRSALARVVDEGIEELLTAEPLLLQELRRHGQSLAVSGAARVSHGCLRTISENAACAFAYSQALAGVQLRRERWKIGRRLAHSGTSALVVPVLRTAHTVRTLAGKFSRRVVLFNLPGIFLQHLFAGLGQAWGYLAGSGDSGERFLNWAIAAPREDP